MQCKLKQGATVSNDFELQEGKYNAITKIISSPVFDEEGNIIKDGVFEAESFDSKKDADEYIDRRYQELLNRYKKLKNEAHQKLNKKLKEYEQQLEKDYEEYKRETGVKKLNPYETGGITLLPEEGYFEKAGKDKEKRKITAEIKKQLDNTINKIIELSDKLKADSSLDKEFKELQKEIGKVNSFKAQGFELSEAQEGIIDSALELVNEINQETYTEAEELFTIGDTTGMALFGSEIEPSKINKLEKDTKFTKETIDNIESKLFAVQDMFKEIEQYDLTEEELASFKENYGKIYVVVKQLESGVVDGSNLIKPPVAEVIELTIDEAIDIIENRSSYEGKLSDKLDNALSQTENLGETNDDTDGETPDDVDDFQEEVYDLKNEEGMVLIYIDPDTGEELPYKLKAQTAPIYTGGYMSNVSIYSTTKPSETKTVDGKTVAVNSKMESAVTNLWENNLNSIWNAADQTTMEEEYGSLEKFIEGSKAAIESLNDNFDNKVFEFRKFKKTYPDFPINRKLKVIDDTHHEVLVMGISVNNKFYPVGEVRNPDGDYDPNGKSYKGEYGNNEEQRQQYQRAYLAIKTLWDKSGYDYSYSPEGYVFKYKGQYEIRNDNEQVLVKDIVNMGHKTIYAVVGSKVLQYNRESKNWEEVKNENKALSIRNIDRNKKTSFKNYILVEINGSFQKLPFSNAINDTKTIKDHEDGMNDLLNKNYDDISDNIKGFSIKKSGGAISAAITLFRFAIITKHEKRNNNNFPHTFSVARKSEGLQTPKIIQTINLNPNLRLVTDIYIDENKKVNIKTYLSEAKENNKGKIVFKRRNKPIKETEIESYNLESFLLHLKSIVKDNDKFSEFLSNNKITFDLKDHVTFNINSGKSIGSLSMLNNLKPIIEIRSSNVPVQKNDYAEKEKARKEEEARKAAEAARRAAEEAIRRQEENNAAYQKAREDAVVLMNEIFSGELNIKGKGVGLVSSVFRESSYNQSFEDSEEAFRVVVYKGKKYFIGKTSKGVTIVFDDTILDVNKDTSKSKVGEVKNPEILNEVLNNDDLTIGYISGVVYNNARYIVHGNGRIISFTSGKDVFEKNSDNKIEKISELVEYVNKEVFGYEETVEEGVAEQTGNIIEDINQELAYNIQKEREEELKNKITYLENKLKSITEKTSASSASSVMDKIEQGDIKNSIKSLKSELNSTPPVKIPDSLKDLIVTTIVHGKEQTIFTTYNLDRTVVFVQIDGKRYGFYQSTKGTDGKIKNHWYPFYGKANGWIVKDGGAKNWKYNTEASPELQEKLKNASERLNREYGNAQFKNVPYIHDESEFETNELIGSNIVDAKQDLQENFDEYINVKKETAEKGFKQPKGAKPFISLRTQQTDEFTEDNNFADDPIETPAVDDTQKNTSSATQEPQKTTANPQTINEDSLLNMFGSTPTETTTTNDPFPNAPKVDGSKIGDDDATFSTSDQKATQQDISKARKILSKIVPFDVREMDPMIQNMLNDKTAIGAFYKNAIYLLDGTQKFHEAFHGVFRTILSDREIDDVLKEAKKKYAKPSLDEISRLRYLTEHNQTLSTEQLINLYYEEKLAEDFQQYMDTGRSVWSRIWDKILDIIRFITGGERDRIYSLFRNIENGKYANSKVRTNSPYAFKEPAFAVINTIRSNSYNNPAKFFVPANQTKTISALIAREIFDDNIDKKKKEDYYPYFSKVREVFNPVKWYEYFKANNDPNIVSNMMTILDYYNALAIPGEPMFMIDANGQIKQIVNVDNIINKNVKSIIDEVNELLKFYVNNDENGENLDDENNDDDYEDETGEPVEIFNRDSYKFGGFKSETSAIRNLMAIITYDKKLFADVGNNKVGDFQGEITMPVQAERLYNKILMLTSGVAKENILDVIAQAADSSNYDIQAFYNYIKEKIDNETSISNNDILVREGGVYDSPTYNLIIKAFYKNNHDYLHIRRRGDSDIAYYPNKFSVKSRVLQRWRSNEKGVMALKSHVRESYLQEFQDIISEELDVNDEYTFTKQMQSASEYLRDATGIELSPLYLKYIYYKRSGISSAFDNIKLPYITNTTLTVLSNTISSGGSLFQSDVVNNEINKILEASAYFNEEQVTFMLRNPEGEQIFTSLYNSYDTEILNTIKESFVEGYINFNVLREKLEQLGYGEQFVDRFMSMVSMNPIFSQKGLNEKDFDVLYSFGMDNASYNKLTDFERRSYKAKVYKNLPADLSNRKIYNPIIIEAKNTNKLFKFASFEKEISFKDGEYNIGEGVEQAINMLYLIEKDSIMRYNEDIEKLVNTGQLEYFIKDYHYRELELRDGSIGKVVYYNNDYYLISENYDTKSYDSHNVFTGYTAEKLQYIPDGFKEPKGAKFFNFGGLDLYDGNVKEFLVSMYLNMNSKDAVVLDNVFNEYQGDQKETKKFQFFVDDMIASSSFQYLLYGGSPTINHKDYVDITKRNAGVNANGSSIGNTSTVFAIIESKELNINDEYIKANNSGNTSQDVQDAQNYATAMWYFSKYAKYKGVASEKGEIRDIALKVVAGIKLTSDEVKVLEKNNMLLIDRKIVVRNSFVYDKTSVHIQAREKVSILREKNTDLVIRRWKEYLENPSPELYNKIIMPMYVAKTGFEYHHNMLNSMEAQGIDITMVTSASKNSTFNVAKNPKNLRGFIVDDRFIHEQVRTDNIKTTITDPTQPLALVFSEQGSPQFQAIGEKFNTIQARRMFEATNKKIASVFTGRFNDPDYEKIWDVVKDSIAATDPQLYELLDVENGIPRYNWNIPNINAKILSAYNSAMSKNSLKQKVKGSKMNLVSSYGHGNDLNWKVTDDRFPGVFFSEVYVSQYFLDKMGLKVGDIMWGTRIPTQDKHSMGNLKIKGVIEGPYAMSIMLPKEMLFLSGADHDLDSLFVKVLNYKYSQNTINAIMDPNVDINKLYNDILNERKRNNPNFDEIALFDDLLLLTGVALTHNEANQDIYATKASLDAIKNSKVRRNENPIQSSISFSDRNNSEDSNYTSKGGIGPAAVLNLVFQKLAKTFPKEFKFTNVEGKRINDLISTHVSGMTDDPKEQIMSGYGLTKNNINKVITLMIAGNITYDQALLSVRDSDFTYAKKEKDRIMEAEYMISKDGVIDDELVKQYEKDGYVFEIVENEKGERYLKSASNPNIPTINNVFKAKVYDNASFLLGEIIRVNRKLPAKASDFFKLENSMLSTAGIRVLREEIYEGNAEYSKINNLFLATNNDFVISDKKIYVDLGTHFTMISFDSKPKKSQKDVNEIVMKVIENDELVFNQLASYLVQSEFASKIFMKYSKIYNRIINKLKEKYDDLIEEASMYGRDDLVIQYKNIKDNVSEYAMAIMNGQKFLADNKKSLYEGLLTESIDDKSYIQFLSERILMEDSGIRLLKDIRYSTVVNEDSGKTYHIASLFTVGEDSDFIRTTYSNDYSNMLNASDNRTVLKDFIASPDKKAFIESLSLADAKVLMVGFIFDYAMLKDGMMYSGTSFSKIIDPRLFVSYGNSINSLQKSFSSNQEFARQYTNNDFSKIDDYVSRMIDYVFNSLNESIKTKEAKAIGINLSRYKPDTNKKATFIFASSGLGKSSLVKNANKRGDSRYVDIDYIIQEALDEVYPNDKGKHTNTAENSRRLGLETSVQNKLKELLSTKYSDKIVLGSISNEKLKAIGFSYSKYYVPSESMIPDIIKGIAERGKGAKDTISGNAYDIELEKYKSLYYDLYVSPNFVDKDKVVVVDSYLDDVINIDKGSIFTETANVSDVTVNGTTYQVIDQSVYKDKKDITPNLSTQLYSLILATRDFADGDSTKQVFNGKEYYVYNENKIFDIENMGFLSQDEIDVLTGKTETEFEGEPIEILSVIESLFNKYKDKEVLGQPITRELLEQLANEFGIDNLEDTLKNCI